ncbi:MAG TPA: tetratricopeptide repeat protein, partial [Blastocatellia bacterium]|nr:tetratricopeptide repeat protein [Blastocatellia bacterium]
VNCLSAGTADPGLIDRAEKFKNEYSDSDDLKEALLALLKDWRAKHKKRLLLLIDNFDMILEQINDERDNARLREVLMNDGTMMIIGGATTFFHEARSYGQPLYNFFKIENLEDLKYPQMQDLLRRRAELDRLKDFEEKLRANTARFKVLEYFTGGNPRLVLMLYRVITQSDLSEIKLGLEKLLDEVTPYYKAKTETLPPQQRKILDYIARMSSKTWEGVTPTEIAKEMRSTPNQVSVQLKRLADLGYVRVANIRHRNSWYILSERLYAIWHQMRFGYDARQRMQWLIDFMRVFYATEEMELEDLKLATRFRDYVGASRLHEARDTLEYRRYLADAMDSLPARMRTYDSIIRAHLDLDDMDTLKQEVLKGIELEKLSTETRERLLEKGCITEQQFEQANKVMPPPIEMDYKAEAAAASELALAAYDEKRYEDALRELDRALNINPENPSAWNNRGVTLGKLNRYEGALESYDCALNINPENPSVWYNRGIALRKLNRYEEALESYDRALNINPENPSAWNNRGFVLDDLNRYEEALESYDRALSIDPEDHSAWYNRGVTLGNISRYEEALESYDRALSIDPEDPGTWYNRGNTLAELNRYEEALESYDRALSIDPEEKRTWLGRAATYLLRYGSMVSKEGIKTDKSDWQEALNSAKHADTQIWAIILLQYLLSLAEEIDMAFARGLITESGIEERLFPLARAIDYLLSRDEALVEKLSPEVRGIVEEIIKKLGNVAGKVNEPAPKKRKGKSKAGARRRTSKQL